MRLAACLAAAALLAAPAHAAESDAAPPSPAAVTFKLGALTLVAVKDAEFVAPNDTKIFGADASVEAVAQVLKAAGMPGDRIPVSIGALVVRSGHRVVLLDTGNGVRAHGVLQDSLHLAGIAPAKVTDVLITHSHGDHVGGLLDADGKPAFPNATVHLSENEWTWLQGKPESAALVDAIRAHVKPFKPGDTVVPGIRSVALDGHTPGHVGYEVQSGKARLLDIGDLAHSSVISLQRPDWAMGFDSDRAVTKVTRRKTLTRLASDQEWVFAPHFPFPSVGHVVADGDGFKWAAGTP